ncbi:uncharacterized protein LOC125673866 isoform X2 [Ostrea edulis]|uniref:uncharacterized protein LOC125673866 isoform X2 n=1 Tax=Ostrea edulis TaxID=37623 RepID=UPI0024AF5013|nr:uncharacterized protein LOC125673866 isoform X2 [Ostrea edulis]
MIHKEISGIDKGCYIKEPTTTRATPTIAMTTTIATTTQSVSTESRDSNYSTQGISRNETMLEMNSCSTETGFLIFFILTTVSLGMVIALLKIQRLNKFCRNIAKSCRKEHPKDKYGGESLNGGENINSGENIPMAEGNNDANA